MIEFIRFAFIEVKREIKKDAMELLNVGSAFIGLFLDD